MTDTTQPSPPKGGFNPRRAMEFAKSEMFDRTFKEGMALVEETAAYLDGPGRAAAKRLPRSAALAYAGESMRLTTRLMQVASWLLVQRAMRDGEIPPIEACSEKYRLASRDQPSAAFAASNELPESLKALIAKGATIFERVRRLDESMYESDGDTPAGNPVSDQMAKIQAAFGR